MSIVASLQSATIGYPGLNLFENFNLDIGAGEFLAIVGPNGSGKTTLMKTLLGLLPLRGGTRVILGKTDPSSHGMAGSVGYIPQRMAVNARIPLTVAEFLRLKTATNLSGEAIRSALDGVGLTGLEEKLIPSLSGGQLQRVFVAFALLGNPKLICLDEATEGLDSKSQEMFLDLLKKISKSETAIVLISHDISAVTAHATRVLCVNREILFDGNPKSPDFHTCLHSVYGKESVIHGHRH